MPLPPQSAPLPANGDFSAAGAASIPGSPLSPASTPPQQPTAIRASKLERLLRVARAIAQRVRHNIPLLVARVRHEAPLVYQRTRNRIPHPVRTFLAHLVAACARLGRWLYHKSRDFIYSRVPEPPLAPGIEQSAPTVDSLPRYVVSGNWKLPASRLPHLLIHDAGPHLEEVVRRLLERLHLEQRPGVLATVAAEMHNEPGVSRPLRFVHQFQKGHISATDVVIRSEGSDLYVRFASEPRTLLTYLRYGWLTAMFLAAFGVLLSAYFVLTGAGDAWIRDYVQKYSAIEYDRANISLDQHGYIADRIDAAPFFANRIRHGRLMFWDDRWAEEWSKIELPSHAFETLKNALCEVADAQVTAAQDMAQKAYGGLGREMAEGMGAIAAAFSGGAELDAYRRMTPHEAGYKLLTNMIHAKIAAAGRDEKALWGDCTELLTSIHLENQFAEALKSVFPEDRDIRARIVRAFVNSTTSEDPWSYVLLFNKDPKIALSNLGMAASIIAAIVGFFVWRAPKAWLRHPCRKLGWNTPDDYNAQVVARNGWIERVLGSTLLEFGIDRSRITELGGQHQS